MLPGIDTGALYNLEHVAPATAVIELWQTEAYSNMQFNKRMSREYVRKARISEKKSAAAAADGQGAGQQPKKKKGPRRLKWDLN